MAIDVSHWKLRKSRSRKCTSMDGTEFDVWIKKLQKHEMIDEGEYKYTFRQLVVRCVLDVPLSEKLPHEEMKRLP